jgi:hypothetical protein
MRTTVPNTANYCKQLRPVAGVEFRHVMGHHIENGVDRRAGAGF